MYSHTFDDCGPPIQFNYGKLKDCCDRQHDTRLFCMGGELVGATKV